MLTLYQLKQNTFFKCCYKSPAYIKNTFLMSILAVILFVIYSLYFRTDGGSLLGAFQILRGLNSNTFNYLQRHTEKLKLHQEIYDFNLAKQKMTSINFFSTCVKYNKPCRFLNLAAEWPALTKWSQENGGQEYLLNLFGENQEIDTFMSPELLTDSW